MSEISDRLRSNGKKAALIPFITAGFPRFESTAAMLHALAEAGADVIELGVPFSDPMADGAAIQRANEVALANRTTLAGVLGQVAEFRGAGGSTPVVLMGYANSFLNYRGDFPAAAAKAGVNGVIIVDLADSDRAVWRENLSAHNVDLIALVAPTTADARLREIAASAQGFLYFIALRGVTGALHLRPQDIAAQAAQIREVSAVPLAVGFGVRSAAQAQEVAGIADAVVVGSRLIEVAEENPADAPKAVGGFVRELAQALQ